MRAAASILMLTALIWTLGLAWFIHDSRQPPQVATVCDGIVTLTGGQSRIDTSMTLLKGGYGQLLLISGVGPHVTLDQLAKLQRQSLSDDMIARITLGRRAVSTIGNAYEITTWAREHKLHSLLVVTAGYHIRRAIVELHRTAPELDLVPYPVLPPALEAPLTRQTLHLLVREYLKLLGAELGNLTGLPDGKAGLTTH
ncbi:YdcF family protein [Gluconobacter japonicus]|uniref:YdcF family protein n=1 Tax=Gluconobacter japonicus TaxID=376620 RepID=UPI0039EC9414